MTKDVLLSITGLQFDGVMDGEQLEVITPGEYYKQNNKHYVLYNEVYEATEQITKNTIKIQNKMIDLMKKGFVNVHMVFEENKKNMTYYNTPYGNILIGINTKKITVDESRDQIAVNVDYALEVNYEFLADCKINIHIRGKNGQPAILPG